MKSNLIYIFLCAFLFTVEVHASSNENSEHILVKLNSLKGGRILSTIRERKIGNSGWKRECYTSYIKMLSNVNKKSHIKNNRALLERLTEKIRHAKEKLNTSKCRDKSTLASYTSDVATVILKALINEKPPIGHAKKQQRTSQEIISDPIAAMSNVYGNVFDKGFGVFVKEFGDVSYQCATTIRENLSNFMFVSYIQYIVDSVSDSTRLKYPNNAPIKLLGTDKYEEKYERLQFTDCNDSDVELINDFLTKSSTYLEYLPEIAIASVNAKVIENKRIGFAIKPTADKRRKNTKQ